MPVNSPFSYNTFTPEDLNWQKKEGYETGYPLPHVLTFQSVIGAAWRTYYHGSHDDAIYHDPEYAIAMQRDPLVMSIVQERCKATVNRKWHVEVDNEKNPAHKAVADGIRKIFNMLPHKRQMFSYMLEGALWAGRICSELKYQDKIIKLPHWKNGQDVEVEVPIPVGHQPIDGDKLNFTYDGIPTIQIYNPKAATLPGAAITVTTQSRALALVGDWRNNFVIHAHEVRDAPFWMAYRAGSIYGVGVRHVIYWLSWLKRELLASILTYAERTGMGLRIWKYQAGNDASRREVQKAAENQTDRTNLLLPVTMAPGGRPVEGVEFIESGSTVSTLLLDILRKFDDDIERFIIGQSLSSGANATGLGSEGIAGFVATTKDNLVEYDADNFGETLTSDVVRKMALWVYPKALVEDANPRFAYQASKPSPAEKLAAVRQVFDMGGKLSENSLMEDAGQPKPEDGEVVLSLEKQQQQQMQLETQAAQAQAAMGQPPGGKPGTGEEPAEPTEDDYNDVMKELVGEGAQQAVGGAQERFQRGGNGNGHAEPLRYLRGRPDAPARHPARAHAAMAHHHLGDDAALHLHNYLNRNQADLRKHRAGSLIRYHLEPDEQDHEEIRRRLLGAKPGNPVRYDRSGEPDMFAALRPRMDPVKAAPKATQTRMPGIFADLAKPEPKPKRAKLPHQDLAHEAMRQLGSDAPAKAKELANETAMEAQAEPKTKKHGAIVAGRVSKHIDELTGDTKGRYEANVLPRAKPHYDKKLEMQDADKMVSTITPRSKRGGIDPHASGHHKVDLATMKAADPALYDQNGQLVQTYSLYPAKLKTNDPDSAIVAFKKYVKANLKFLYDQVPDDIKKRSKLWYDGARKMAEDWSKKYGFSREQMAGVIANLSPQKDWFQNISLAERMLDIHVNKGDEPYSDEMAGLSKIMLSGRSPTTGAKNDISPKTQEVYRQIAGKTYNELESNVEKACWMTLYDMAHNSPHFPVLNPEGIKGDVRRNYPKEGEEIGKETTRAWPGAEAMAKTIDVLRNGEISNISASLGLAHKVRSFFNNILLPDSKDGDVTIDTHQVAASHLSPFGSSDREVLDNFKGSKDVSGIGGTYAIYGDAHRELADELGILPRELQSITWEAVRGLFKPEDKRNKTLKPAAQKIWLEYHQGERTLKNAQQSIVKLFGGINPPEWHAKERQRSSV